MKRTGRAGLWLFALILSVLLLPSPTTSQVRCNLKGIVTQDTDIYRQVPNYVTGSGWVGERITRLNANTQVYICGEQGASYGFSTKTWLHIAYLGLNNEWFYGWVLQDTMTVLSSGLRRIETIGSPSLVAVAFAAGAPLEGTDKTTWAIGPPPAAPAPQSADISSSSSRQPGSASLSDLGELYWPLFVAMLSGMLAKVGVDWLDASGKAIMQQHLRNFVISVLVSPIVFLGFLTGGQFSTTTQTFLVLCLMAFQNGFFWQTVLKRNVPSTPPGAAADAAGI